RRRSGASRAREKHELCEGDRHEPPVPERREPGLRDADDLVLEERVELDALACVRGADERELDAAAPQALEDLGARRDLDLDRDAGMVATEAAERVREQVDAGRRRGAAMEGPGLEARERGEP